MDNHDGFRRPSKLFVVGLRTRIKNQLQHVALNEGLQKKQQLWTKPGRQWLELLPLPLWTARRRADLLQLLDELEEKVRELGRAVVEAADEDARVQLLMTHPGVGAVTGLAFVLVVGDVARIRRSKNQFLRERNGASERLSRACALVCS